MLESEVFNQNPDSIEDLKQAIFEATEALNHYPEMIKRV